MFGRGTYGTYGGVARTYGKKGMLGAQPLSGGSARISQKKLLHQRSRMDLGIFSIPSGKLT